MLKATRSSRRRERGVGLVELLVGLAVGLFVVGGGLLLFANFVQNDRRLVLEARLMQDLRAASDLVTRDIRRGGYWDAATSSVWVAGGASTTPRNPFALVRQGACSGATTANAASEPTGAAAAACYWVDNGANAAVNDAERYGFDVSGGVLYAVVADQRTALTDPASITITDLRFDWTGTQSINASNFCAKTCTANCPTVVVREVEVTIRGTVPGDTSIARQLRSNVRVRNDLFTGQCPA